MIPGLLILVCAADVGARFLSVDPLTFRAWEALSRYRPPGAAFEPNRRYVRARSYGDAAAMGNMPDLRHNHPETFTTDARGFRNVASADRAPMGAILAGSSFAVGSGVSDHETLSTALSGRAGCGVYNAGGMDPDPDRLRALAEELGLPRGLVLDAYAEDTELPVVPTQRKRDVNRWIAMATAPVARAAGLVRGFLLVSPLRILSERAFKRIANDRILPNGYRSNIVSARLRNGDAMLFVASKLASVRSQRQASAAYWVWMQEELRKRSGPTSDTRLDLLVVLVPSRYTVYRDLLVDQPPLEPGAAGFLDCLEHELRAAGIPVVNLTTTLAAEAARQAEHHEYLYWRDDIHWNSEGIGLAATAILHNPAFSTLPCRQHRALAVEAPAVD